jgi:hypothetical protein
MTTTGLRTTAAFALCIAVSCARLTPPQPPQTPEEQRRTCFARCTGVFVLEGDFAKMSQCQLACMGATPAPRPVPRVEIPTATATNAPAATPTPAPVTQMWVEPSRCHGKPSDNPGVPGPTFRQEVIRAIDSYCPAFPANCNPEGRRVKDGLQDHYYDFVAAHLRGQGLESWVDLCGGSGRCGEIQVAAGGTRFLSPGSWAEGYHVLTSPGQGAKPPIYWDLDCCNFTGRCEPKWWTSAADGVVSAPTVVPTAGPTPTPTVARLLPPTLSHFNGCTDGSGRCEFAQWFKIELPSDRPQPPCGWGECPAFWQAPGMAKTCDHMYAEEKDGGRFEPRAGRHVTIMWYVCGGRKWDDPRGPVLHTTYPAHCDQPGFRRVDRFNANCYGPGTVTVCAHDDAYACADPADYLDKAVTYNPASPGCASGTIPLPGAGSCVGPFVVR